MTYEVSQSTLDLSLPIVLRTRYYLLVGGGGEGKGTSRYLPT